MQKFFSLLKKNHLDNTNFIEKIAVILDINYDAAYRRINGMSKISLEEALLLAKHYKVSIDNLIEFDESDFLFLKKKNKLENIDAIAAYLEDSYTLLSPFLKLKDASVIYASKDIPIFYTLGNDILSRFKMYAWTWTLDSKFSNLKLLFRDFVLPEKLLDSGTKLNQLYQSLNISEFWNETILNSTLYQVKYFYELQIITKKELIIICKQLSQLLQNIEQKTKATKPSKYAIYMNEMTLMNNAVLFHAKKKSLILFPINILGYLELNNQNIVEDQKNFYMMQKENSILLSDGNQKQRMLFFNNLHQKINDFVESI